MGAAAFAALAAAVLVAAFVQGSTGVGFALLMAPVAALIDPQLLPVTVLILMVPVTILVAWRERQHIDVRGAGWASLTRVAFTPVGVWLLSAVSDRGLGLLAGGVMILAAVVSLVAPAFDPTRPALLIAGAVTGVTETATGIGGPPYALVYQHRPAPELRATLALCFLVGQIVSLAALAITGRLTGTDHSVALWLLPAAVAGAWLSSTVHHRVGGRGLRVGILLFAALSGVIVAARALWGS